MARVVSNNNDNIALPTFTPFMDRLTHSVIKETSKSLKYYIDVKRRENAFVLNPNSTSLDSVPLKARFIYGTTKEYPPLYGSCHSDNDVKVYLRSSQQKQKQRQSYSRSSSPEKQMCREELNFHMREVTYSPRENQKFSELRLKPPSRRSTSSCSGTNGRRESRKRIPNSLFKSSRYQQDQLVDDAADILASMVKTRRTIYETNFLSQQTLPNYVSRNTNPSPRQAGDQSIVESLTHPSIDLKLLTTIEESQKPKRTTENQLAKAASIMHNAKPINERGLLCEYKISVTTGNCNGASTKAPISIKLYGSNGYTPVLNLIESDSHRVPFLKDQTDLFLIQTYHVGQLVGITIGHDRKDMRSGWFLNKVSIDDPIREITYDIPCNAWLSSKSNDQKTMRDFQVTSMVSHKKKFGSDEHREEIESQSDRSATTNSSENNQLTNHKRTKRNFKQQNVSIGPAPVLKRPASLTAITNHLSQSPPTTIESHFNRDELSRAPVLPPRGRSPIINRTPSESEIEDNVVNHSRSTTPILNPSASNRKTSQSTDSSTNGILKHHSTNHNRPPARLEKRNSPISLSPERPIKTKEETNEDDAFSFFE